MSQPLVSICIPTYNGQTYLQETLDCITKQTYNNIEVIVSDDASKDETLKLVETFKNQGAVNATKFSKFIPEIICSQIFQTIKIALK